MLAPLGASPWLLGFAGLVYGAVAVVGGALDGGARLAGVAHGRRRAARRRRKRLFAFSILYLFVLFAVLLVDGRLRAVRRPDVS